MIGKIIGVLLLAEKHCINSSMPFSAQLQLFSGDGFAACNFRLTLNFMSNARFKQRFNRSISHDKSGGITTGSLSIPVFKFMKKMFQTVRLTQRQTVKSPILILSSLFLYLWP